MNQLFGRTYSCSTSTGPSCWRNFAIVVRVAPIIQITS